MHNQEYNFPVFVVNSGIATSGHVNDIAPGQLGLYSRNNYSVVSSPSPREEIFFAMGSTRKYDSIGDVSGLKDSEKSTFFKVKDVVNFEVSNAQKITRSNKLSIGYSGASDSLGIKYECDKNYVLKIYLKGSPILRYFGKPLEKIISYNTGCCGEDCATCPDTTLDCELHTKAIVKLINDEIELKQVGVKARFVSNLYSAPSVQATGTAVVTGTAVSSVTIVNGGTGYTSGTVTFTGDGTGATGTTTVVNGVITAVTITAGGSGYSSAPIATFSAPSNRRNKYCLEVCDNGDTPALQAIQTNAGVAGVVTRTGRADCKSQYTYCGDVAAGNFTPTQDVLLSICGVCPTGYTAVAAMDTITIVRPITPSTNLSTIGAQATYAGTIATAYTAYSPINARFNSQSGATASVSFEVPTGTVVVALLSDTVIVGVKIEASCSPSVAATAIAWTVCGTAYKTKRKLKVTLQRTDCNDADRLSELTAFYATTPNVVSGTILKLSGSVGCEDTYTIEQWSNGCLTDDCLATDSGDYTNLGSFDGQVWTVVPEVVSVNPTRKCGFTIQAEVPETVFGDCSFDPQDFYENEPPHLEAIWELNYPDTCKLGSLPVIKNVEEQLYRRQSGEWVIRKLIEWSAYHWASSWNVNPRFREALGQEVLSQVDRNAFYKVYYTKFVESRAGVNTFAEQPRIFEPLVIFKETDAASGTFEKMFAKAISSTNIVLNKREGVINW